MKNLVEIVGKNIKALRASRGLAQIELAKMIPMAQAFLSRIERGVQDPSLEMLGKIAQALRCDVAELLKVEASDAVQSPEEANKTEAGGDKTENLSETLRKVPGHLIYDYDKHHLDLPDTPANRVKFYQIVDKLMIGDTHEKKIIVKENRAVAPLGMAEDAETISA